MQQLIKDVQVPASLGLYYAVSQPVQ